MMTQNDKMERAAILHIPLSEYAFAESEYGGGLWGAERRSGGCGRGGL